MAERWPTLAAHAWRLFALGLVAYCVLASLFSVLTAELRDGCDRGNVSRVAELEDTIASAKEARDVARQVQDREIAAIFSERADRLDDKADDLKAAAEDFGAVPGSVVIPCDKAYPEKLPWIG